jgi:histidinol-phosphatase (PHP family)
MFDSHVHTTFSTDSKMNIEDAIKRSEELSIGLIVTEHMDINYPSLNKFVFNQDEYFKQYSKYISPKLLLGIELGMRMDCIEENRNLVERYPFDYVIGSVHLVDNIDLYTNIFYKGKSKNEAYEKYLKYMLDCLRSYNFVDSLGHIDYIARYAFYKDKEIYYENFADYIDEVIKAAILNNIVLEINTRRFNNISAVDNLKKIYKRYYELGGRMVTLGSDSHTVQDIGSHFQLAKNLADSCNLKPVYFKKRKPEYIK